MEEYLLSIGVGGDVSLIADLLADAGMASIDDLMLTEPSMDDLFDAGIVNEEDRMAIFYATHPEEAPGGGADLMAAMGLADDFSNLDQLVRSEPEPEWTDPTELDYGADNYTDDLGLELDEIERLGLDFENDENAQELAMISAYLARLEANRELTNDWLIASDPDQIDVSFDKAAYTRAFTFLEQGNTSAFKAAIAEMDVNMKDPDMHNNTLLHWCVPFKNAIAAQAIIDQGGLQLMNADGKTPVEIALDAFNSDSSFFEVRNVLGRHAQEMIKKTGSLGQ